MGTYAAHVACHSIKDALCIVPMLYYLYSSEPYPLLRGAFDTLVGEVLMQDHGNDLRFIACLRSALQPIEKKNSPCEHEMAANAYSFIAWRHVMPSRKSFFTTCLIAAAAKLWDCRVKSFDFQGTLRYLVAARAQSYQTTELAE